MQRIFDKTLAFFTLFACLAAFQPAFAASELEKTKADLKKAQERGSEIAKQNDELEEELAALQKRLIPSAQAVQKYEAELSTTEDKLLILDEQLGKKETDLAAAKKRQASLVQAALRLSRTPPEAAIVMPGDQMQSMKAARALEMTTASIKQEAGSIHLQMEELRQIRRKVEGHRKELQRKQELLSKEQQNLLAKVAQRQELQRQLAREQSHEEEKIARLTKQADNLQELFGSLSREEQKEDDRSSGGHKGKLRSFASAQGKIRLPVVGKLAERFGAKNKGVKIEAREGAQVVAPYDGEVVFAGPFLHYGKMVIVRHSDDFHTLLSPLAKIHVSVGEFLLEGEPIGAMGEDESESSLYVELRKNNQPVDPALWLKGLKK